MSDDFLEKTKRILQDRAGNRCSNPECRALTSGPNAHPEKATKTGVACHITAASPGGPRFNSSLTSEQRRSAENGIWLCQTCAHFIDTDCLNYSIHLLYNWKYQAEQEADDETKGRKAKLSLLPPLSEQPQKKGWICPFCGTVVEIGNSVCLGCQAEVVPGLTRLERQEAFKEGAIIGCGFAIALFVILPNWLKSSYGWNVDLFWGLGSYGLAIGVIMTLAGGFAFVTYCENKKLNELPRFFRSSIR